MRDVYVFSLFSPDAYMPKKQVVAMWITLVSRVNAKYTTKKRTGSINHGMTKFLLAVSCYSNALLKI